MSNEFVIYITAIFCIFSRASLNVIDRSQYFNQKLCPIILGYWNNLIPSVFAIFIFYLTSVDVEIKLSVEAFMLATVIQIVSYSFSFCLRFFKVMHLAVISKISDLTISVSLIFLGFNQGFFILTTGFLSLLMAALLVFFNKIYKNYLALIILIFVMTINGVLAFLFKEWNIVDNNANTIILFTCEVAFWRLLFSVFPLFIKHGLLSFFSFPSSSINSLQFFLRSLLSISTQSTFIFLITQELFILAIPILNLTAMAGALMAILFLNERFTKPDLVVMSVIFLSSSIPFFNSYEQHKI